MVIVALIIGLIVSFNIGGKSDGITKNEEEGMVANTNEGIMSVKQPMKVYNFLTFH